MNAILLVGGFGTRLRPLTLHRPKGLMPVLNRPFLSYQLELFRNTPVNNIVLAAGLHNRLWEADFRRLGSEKLKLHFSYEPRPMGTGGAIRFAYDLLKRKGLGSQEPVVVFNGDVFYDIDIKNLVNYHRKKQSQVTISLVKVQDPSRYGVVPFDSSRRIRGFIEKPHKFRKPTWINGGAYVLEGNWIEKIPVRPCSLEKESFPRALRQGDRLYAYLTKGYWNDIGTHEAYLRAHLDLGRNKMFLGKGLQRGKNVVLAGAVSLGSAVKLGDGCRIKNSVLFDGVEIGPESVIEEALIGASSRIGSYVSVRPGTVLGDKSIVPSYSKL